jgi:LemA protein
MGMFFWIGLAIALVYTVTVYNDLVSVKHGVTKAWSNIDVLLKQRHDELPKLVDTCKQYMAHEQQTLEKVIQARAQVSSAREAHNIGALGAAETALRSGLGQLFALAESFCTCRRALADSKTPSPTGASFTTSRSTSTT